MKTNNKIPMVGEFFYLDKNGVPRDAELHEELLQSVEGNRASDLAGFEAALQCLPLDVALKHFASPELRDWLKAQKSFSLS
jgi:hypothetical protein